MGWGPKREENGEFSRRLVVAMAKRGMTLAELAEATQLPVSTISESRAGRQAPKFHSLVRLCRALSVSADWLCCLGEMTWE